MAKRQTTKLRRSCGAMAAHMMLLEQYPSFRANQLRLEGAAAKRREEKYDPKTAKLITIKTIVHVVYQTDEQNISDGQIKSQIKALNLDYRAKNPDKSKVPAAWKGLVADARIEFKLVKVPGKSYFQTLRDKLRWGAPPNYQQGPVEPPRD